MMIAAIRTRCISQRVPNNPAAGRDDAALRERSGRLGALTRSFPNVPRPYAVVSLVMATVWILGGGWAARSAADEGRVQLAVDAYLEAMETSDRHQRVQRFAQAEQLFRRLLDGDAQHPPLRNAELFVNAGNAALQAERVGPAIAAYRRALALDPRHARARQNLAYARSLVPDWARRPDSPHYLDTLFFWHALLTPAQVSLVACGWFLVAAILFAWGHATNRSPARFLAALPWLIWLILTLSLWWNRTGHAPGEVVVVTETVLRSADSENASPRLANPLPSGAELDLLQQQDRWSEVRVPGGRTGWLLTSALERIDN
jgi:tetratricopeptide (TPR) repeat protein